MTKPVLKKDLCILGAGAAGLTIAAVATQLGLEVVIIERDKMGGDCLNYGCVPSKALLEAARIAAMPSQSEAFGIQLSAQINFTKVMTHVQDVIKTIAVKDSQQRFEQLGAQVLLASARFINEKQIEAGHVIIEAKHTVIATGSSPFIPAIPGLTATPYLTNETIFGLTQLPEHLIVMGGGPIGCELGQAFRLLGSQVTIIEALHILMHDETALVAELRQQFIKQNITLLENSKVVAVSQTGTGVNVTVETSQGQQRITGSHLLVAVGHRPNVKALNLEAAGIHYTEKGITTDAHMRTNKKHIYAIGDVTGGYQFTHIANYQAGIVIRNLLFRLPAKVNYQAIPWVTYTIPELAHAGMTEAEARKQAANIKIISVPFSEVDRAQTAHATSGQIRVITNNKGTVLGVSILGKDAGELITPWLLMITKKMKIRSLTEIIVPYPTLSEINKFAAVAFYKNWLFSKWVRMWVKLINQFF